MRFVAMCKSLEIRLVIKKTASVSEGRLAFSNFILRMRCRGRRSRGCSALRVAFDVGGGQPCGHLGGLAGVFVVHDGVQGGHGLHPLCNKLADGGGVAHAGFAFGFALRGVRAVGGAVGLQGGHKVRWHFVRYKFCDERGLRGELLDEFVGGGQQGVRIELRGRAEAVGKAGLRLVNRGGGAGDVLEVEPDGVEQHFLAGVAPRLLSGLGRVQTSDDGGDGGEVGGGGAGGRKIGGVIRAESLHANEHFITTSFTTIHNDPFYLVDGCLEVPV